MKHCASTPSMISRARPSSVLSLRPTRGRTHNFCDAVLAVDIFEQAFGFTFISHRGQTFRLGEREESFHHSRGAQVVDRKPKYPSLKRM
jgi:hypothetical protein